MSFILSVVAWALGLTAGLFIVGLVTGVLGIKRVPLKKLLLLTYGDDLVYGAMNFPGHSFDINGKVVVGSGGNTYLYGSCGWIGRWKSWAFYFAWLVKPVKYSEHNKDGFGSDIYVDLADHFVTVEVKNAETKDILDPNQDPGSDPKNPRMIAGPAASFTVQCPGAVVDPKLFVIGSPPDVFQKGILDEFVAIMRKWARTQTEAELLNASVSGQIGQDLLDPVKVNAKSTFDIMLNRWGFNLPAESITIKDISFSKAYQEARQAARMAQMEAQATRARVYDPVLAALPAGTTLTADQAVRLRALDMGATVEDFNIHSNGQSINPNALVLGSGGAGLMVGGGRNGRGNSGGRGRQDNRDNSRGGKGSSEKPPEEMDDEELDAWAEKFKKNKGKEE